MTITKNVPSEVYDRISKSQTLIDRISAYIDDPMTATTFRNDPSKRGSREGITAELIYYWMISQGIPVEFEKWHINSLLTLIRVCNVKNSPGKGYRSSCFHRFQTGNFRSHYYSHSYCYIHILCCIRNHNHIRNHIHNW